MSTGDTQLPIVKGRYAMAPSNHGQDDPDSAPGAAELILSESDFVRFWESCNAAPAPNEALRKAAQRRVQNLENGTLIVKQYCPDD